MPNYFRNLYIATLPSSKDYKVDWPLEKLKGWIKRAGGKHQLKLTDETTHLVVSRKAWNEKQNIIKAALQTNRYNEEDDRSRRIKIVSWDWLEDSLTKKNKKPEGPYDFEKMERQQQAAELKLNQKAERQQNLGDGPNTVAGLMGEAFKKEIERPFTDRERITMEAEDKENVKERLRAKEEQKNHLELLRRQYREEHRSIFRKGVKRARDELMTDNYHVYQDSTGFKYEVALTKVLAQQNRNERIILTIYESNAMPPAYAMNTLHAGTGKLQETNTVVAVGSTYELAFMFFQKLFFEKTGLEWDERIEKGLAQAKQRNAERDSNTFLQPAAVRMARDKGHQKGRSAVEEDEHQWIQQRLSFDAAKFEYHPPAYGPVGWLEPGQEQKVEAFQALLANRKPRKQVRQQSDMSWQEKFSQELEEVGFGAANGLQISTNDSRLDFNFKGGVDAPAQTYNGPFESQNDLGEFIGEPTPFSLNNQAPSRAATEFNFDEFNSTGVPYHENTRVSKARLTPDLVFSRATANVMDDEDVSCHTMVGALQSAVSCSNSPNPLGVAEIPNNSLVPGVNGNENGSMDVRLRSANDPRLRERSW